MFERPSRRLLILLIGLTLVAAALIVWPPRLEAHGDVQTLISYFSSSTYQTKVGERIFYCDGHLQQWGSVTSYTRREDFLCPDPEP